MLFDRLRPLTLNSLSFASDTTNSGHHFAAGDIAAWNGLKSVGGALLMGQCAAVNIIGHLGVATQQTTTAGFGPAQLPPFPLMMSLAVGREAAAIDMNGTVDSGEHLRESFFGGDLALASKFPVHLFLDLDIDDFAETRELLGLSGPEDGMEIKETQQ